MFLSLFYGCVGCPARAATPIPRLYNKAPVSADSVGFGMMNMGRYGTGVVMADMNNDGLVDVVISNGNDMSPQPVSIYYNQGGNSYLPQHPSWESNVGYFSGLSVGDINKDGWLDLVVTQYSSPLREMSAGGVLVYLSHAGRLPTDPAQVIPGRVTVGCALGDYDADGDLDLAIAPVMQNSGILGSQPPTQLPPLPAQIFENIDGTFQKEPVWQTPESFSSLDVRFADVDLDGWLDFIVAADRIYVHRGRPIETEIPTASTPHATLDAALAWESPDDGLPYHYGVDYGLMSADDPAQAIVFSSSNPVESTQQSYFTAYQYGADAPFWRFDEPEYASKVWLGDLDLDGMLDVITTEWGAQTADVLKPYTRGPVRIFAGQSDGISEQPVFVSSATAIGQEISAGPLPPDCTNKETHTFTAGDASAAVITLPHRRVVSIESVETGSILSSWQFAWTPEDNWVSLATPLGAGESVTITYTVAVRYDIVVDTWDPDIQDFTFPSYASCP